MFATVTASATGTSGAITIDEVAGGGDIILDGVDITNAANADDITVSAADGDVLVPAEVAGDGGAAAYYAFDGDLLADETANGRDLSPVGSAALTGTAAFGLGALDAGARGNRVEAGR